MINSLAISIQSTLPDHSKVWVYQSDRAFSEVETTQVEHLAEQFALSWASHGTDLRAEGYILYNRFLVLIVDEANMGASGCSIDKSVAFVKYLEQTYEVGFFDRFLFAYFDEKNTVKVADKDDFANLVAQNKLSSDTLVFDNLVKTLGELKSSWIKPLSKSWHRRFV